MIYDIITTTIFKNEKPYIEEDSVEAPTIVAAIVYVSDGLRDDPYEPHLEGDEEGSITISAKEAINNVPAYQLHKASVRVDGKDKMITGWDPIY